MLMIWSSVPAELLITIVSFVPEITKLVVDVMENACKLDAPLKANAEVGKNWRDMETVH